MAAAALETLGCVCSYYKRWGFVSSVTRSYERVIGLIETCDRKRDLSSLSSLIIPTSRGLHL